MTSLSLFAELRKWPPWSGSVVFVISFIDFNCDYKTILHIQGVLKLQVGLCLTFAGMIVWRRCLWATQLKATWNNWYNNGLHFGNCVISLVARRCLATCLTGYRVYTWISNWMLINNHPHVIRMWYKMWYFLLRDVSALRGSLRMARKMGIQNQGSWYFII